ncbi:BamA/TamA family outer membrane protein [Galbibacter sp. BG1]|uniref:BamA/TamA family outer membrane protein n=1 Tax=Galbibacter sp. BG1 TaxID=1170699 RepID=UPI0015B99594|nr:BamA/TamA family outer membrane protein [Galbibacter sp. BG1]QLE00723.1 BamA/TamA family outer membrane protein [Galbibacter sp. BG1]
MLTSVSLAQERGIKKWFKERQALKKEKIEAGEPFLTPLLGPGYTPENGFLIAGGVLYTFKTDPQDSLIQRSSMPLTAFISTRGNIGLNGKLQSFWWEDRFRLNVVAKYSDADDDYFGVGIQENQNIEKSDSTSLYHRNQWSIQPGFLFRIIPNLYLGLNFNVNKTKVTEVNPLMAQDSDFLRYGPENFNSASGLSLAFDSRDLTVNAWKGMYIRVASLFFGSYLGSNNTYQTYEVDFRTYHQIYREGNVLAAKFYLRSAHGDVPYEELGRIGGGDALRGYIKGQYRDKTAIYFMTEWRHMFLKSDGVLSKHGLATWLGTGTVAPGIDEVSQWVPNLGVGYRLEVQPRMNLRIDFGVGRESSGLYFGFSEAF